MANMYKSILESVLTPTGNATNADVLSGKTFMNINGAQTGSMVNNGAVNQTISVGQSYTIPAGYHNGQGIVTASGNVDDFDSWQLGYWCDLESYGIRRYYGTMRETLQAPGLKDSTKFGLVTSTTEENMNDYFSIKLNDTPSNIYNNGGTITIKCIKKAKVIGCYYTKSTYGYITVKINEEIYNVGDTITITAYKPYSSTSYEAEGFLYAKGV